MYATERMSNATASVVICSSVLTNSSGELPCSICANTMCCDKLMLMFLIFHCIIGIFELGLSQLINSKCI